MSIEKRLLMCRLIEKMERDKDYANRLGINNISAFRENSKLDFERKQ